MASLEGSRRILCGPAAGSQPGGTLYVVLRRPSISFFLFLFQFAMPFPPSFPSAPTVVQREDRRRLVPRPRFGGRITGGSSLDLGAVDLVLRRSRSRVSVRGSPTTFPSTSRRSSMAGSNMFWVYVFPTFALSMFTRRIANDLSLDLGSAGADRCERKR